MEIPHLAIVYDLEWGGIGEWWPQDIDLATRMSGDPFPAFDPHKDMELGHLLRCAPLNLRGEI